MRVGLIIEGVIIEVDSEKENRGKSEEKRNTKLENVKNHAVAVNFNSCICIYEFKNRRFVIVQ